MSNPEPYRLAMAHFPGRVQVLWRGTVIADTTNAVKLEESRHAAVYYVPRADAQMALFHRTAHRTHCPHKGDASYFTLVGADGTRAENAVWSYETPIAKSATIAGHLAFYTRDMNPAFSIDVVATPERR